MSDKQTPYSSKTIRVVIIEDHEITRVGLRLTLEQSSDVEIVGEAADGRNAVELVTEARPDVVLMDIGLPFVDGIQATEDIKRAFPHTRVIMLTSHDNDRDVFAALGAGADGYCLKETATNQLALAIKAVSDGAAWLDPGIASRVLRASVAAGLPESSRPTTPRSASRLSKREIEVLKLVIEGLSNQQIAERLVLSIETVKTHMRRIMEKLAVSDRTQAAVKAMREGLL